MKLHWNWSLEKNKQWVVKFAVSILLVGVAFRLHFSQSTGFSEVAETLNPQPTKPVDKIPNNDSPISIDPQKQVPVDLQENRNKILDNGTQVSANPEPTKSVDLQGNREENPDNGTKVSLDPKSPASVDLPENPDQIPTKEKCDLFTGDWIPSQSGPLYTNESCNLIEGHQNCMKNGRPDTGYLYWRWNPRDCELPPFDAGLFLEFMRNKMWALIGDSITRNHVQSLLCILSKVEQAVEVYPDEEYRSKRWHFASYNFTVSVIWSPFLAKAAIFEDYNGVSSSEVKLHLDKLDPSWTDNYQASDYMIFSSGKWFVKSTIYYENNTILGCHNCPKRNLTHVGFNFAYRKVLQSVFSFIVSSNHTGTFFYRASTPDHFENGEWYNGGSCQRKVPAKEGEFEMNELSKILRVVELEEFEKAAAEASQKGMKLKLLDVMQLSLLRPDGHPGLYRYFHPQEMDNSTKIFYDCLHWCLPGPMDSWNDLLMEMVVNG